MHKQVKVAICAAIDAGWEVVYKGNHYKLRPPDKRRAIVTISATPSDNRAIANIRADLRRSGLDV